MLPPAFHAIVESEMCQAFNTAGSLTVVRSSGFALRMDANKVEQRVIMARVDNNLAIVTNGHDELSVLLSEFLGQGVGKYIFPRYQEPKCALSG